MRLLCLLLAAAPAVAAEFDINAPGFWSKTYAFPRSYCERSITLVSPHVKKLVEGASPCKFVSYEGGVRSDCRLSLEESDRIVGELKRLGTLTAYSQNCDPSPSNPELYYKRDNLRREREAIELSSAAAPAINGLLDAQLSALDQLITSHESALEASLNIVIVSSEGGDFDGADSARVAGAAPWRFPRKIARKRDYPQDAVPHAPSWARRALAACQQIEPIVVEYARTGGPADAERLGAARRLGKPYADAECGLLRNPALAAAVFSMKPELEIRKRLMSLSGLRSWRVGTLDGGVVPDDLRFDGLSAERAAQRETLSRAPHIRGLVDAEIERVRGNAERLRKLRRGRLLLIQFVQ